MSDSQAPSARRRTALLTLLTLLLAWGLGFIWRSSFVVEGTRIFCLFDDAMISMTYARNLLGGLGLEWARQGAPVEGFTHPLWLVAMLPANLPPIPLPLRSLPVQLLSLLLLAATTAMVVRLLVDCFQARETRQWLPAAALTAFYYPLAYWSLMGMESALQALLTVTALWLALSITERGLDRQRTLWVICSAAYLLRMDLILLVGVTQFWVVARGALRVKEQRRHWLQGLALFAGTALAYEAFRELYFHDLLPNTYYLKLTGIPLDVRLLRGWKTFFVFAHGVWPLLLIAGLGALVLARRDRRVDRRIALLVAPILVTFAYDVWIGGDAWELSEQAIGVAANRFLAPVMPLVFILIGLLVNRLERIRPWASGLVAIALIVVAFLSANDLAFSDSAPAHRRQMALLDPPPNVEREQAVLLELRRFEGLVTPGAVVATAWAGIPAFFSDYRMIDILGYNDRTIARLPSSVPLDLRTWRRYIPGHVKWDEHRLLTEQRPDAFFQIWGPKHNRQYHELLPEEGYRFFRHFWVRADSTFVHPPQTGFATMHAAHRHPLPGRGIPPRNPATAPS